MMLESFRTLRGIFKFLDIIRFLPMVEMTAHIFSLFCKDFYTIIIMVITRADTLQGMEQYGNAKIPGVLKAPYRFAFLVTPNGPYTSPCHLERAIPLAPVVSNGHKAGEILKISPFGRNDICRAK